MHLVVVGHVLHKTLGDKIYAYGPYVREMNRWFQFVDQVTIVSPLDSNMLPDPIDLAYDHPNLSVTRVPQFNLLSVGSAFLTVFQIPGMLLKIALAMGKADHIHLRCPGNMGLLGTVVQMAFPQKIKTAKYAGNWDRRSPKPLSYRWQQSLLSNPRLTRNMKVLVYGEWPGETSNIYPFFTASYSESEKEPLVVRSLDKDQPIRLIFVGTLSSGKNPLLTAQVGHQLIQKGKNIQLEFFGEGSEREKLETYIQQNQLGDKIFLRGNVPASHVKKALQRSHFLIFLSKSEGWPKVVAEAMFWGCLPVTTRISCVPQMLAEGLRGNLVAENVDEVIQSILDDLENPEMYFLKTQAAAAWSRQFTLEKFEKEIKDFLKAN